MNEAKRCTRCDERNTAISYCFVCNVYLCVACDRKHRHVRDTRGHRKRLLQRNVEIEDLLQRPVMCTEWRHDKETVNLYCQQCHECICQICHEDYHRSHYVVYIHTAARRGKKELNEAIMKAEEEITACEDEMEENTFILESRKREIRAARRNVTEIVKKLIKSLEKHKKAVLTELDELDKQYRKRHATDQEKLKQSVARLNSPVEHGKGILRRNVDVEIVKEKQVIIDRCEDLLNSNKTDTMFDLPFVNYVTDEELSERFRLSCPGQLIVSKTDPSQSEAWGKGLRKTVVDEETIISVVTNDSGGNQCYYEDDIVEVKIQSPSREELEKEFKDANDGEYKVRFTPKSVGQHEVMINVNGQPLADSPWSIQVNPRQYEIKYKLGTRTEGEARDDDVEDDDNDDSYDDDDDNYVDIFYDIERRLSLPRDVAISQVTGNIAVLDLCGIKLYNAHGKYLNGFGSRCTGKRLKDPQSVAVSCSGDIIVIDRQTITLCTERGSFVRHFMKHTTSPCSVSVSRAGRVIVCDSDDALVKVLSPNGEKLLRSFGDPELYGIPSFAIHHKDKFFVSYRKKHCVVVFSNDGTFLYNIGAPEDNKMKSLKNPLGLAVDKFNNLIVCDSSASRLQVFSLEGKYLSTITGFGSPQFVAVSKDGHLYVADKEKDCVYVLK